MINTLLDKIKYDKYCEENYDELREWYKEYLRDLGYWVIEWVDDWYEEYCRESYIEICEKHEVPLFPAIK